MVAEWGCIVRKWVRAADGRVKPRVKPGHDVGGVGRDGAAGFDGPTVGIFGGWYQSPDDMARAVCRAPVVSNSVM